MAGLDPGEAEMNFYPAIFATAILMAGAFSPPALAQQGPGIHQDNGGLNGSLSRGDLEKLSGDHRNDAKNKNDTPEARAKAKTQSAGLLASLQLTCDIGDAKLVAAGKIKPKTGGKEVDATVYEVACNHAMGYLLEAQGTDTPLAISCLSAEEARAADAARGKEPSYFCQLPGNADVYAFVKGMIIDGTGAQCTVRSLQNYGHSESTHSDYSEVACTDGNGFLLRIARPGFDAKTVVMSCNEAARQNIKCKMTDAAPVDAPVVTTQTFKEALARNGVSCSIGQIRVIGQEEHLKRYVVEYLCVDQAIGTVAFIPLTGNTNPFESQGCAAALSDRGVKCSLAPMN
jgi:hypothetical protein